MGFLVSLELGGRLAMPSLPYMRWGWKVPVLAVLVLMFVIPHDPSTRIKQTGSQGFRIHHVAHSFASRQRSGSKPAAATTPSPRPPASPLPAAVSMSLAASLSGHWIFAPEATVASLRRVATVRRNVKSTQAAIADLVTTSLNATAATAAVAAATSAAAAVALSQQIDASAAALSQHFDASAVMLPWLFARAATETPPAAAEAAASSASASAEFECEAAQRGHDAVVAAILSQSLPHNATALAATTVEELRRRYGHRCSWWGDLDARETRSLYHQLLPTELLTNDELPVATRARVAVAARRAARLYARERTILPVALSCQLLDGVRHLIKEGSFQPDGYSEAQIWEKYARQHGLTLRPLADTDADTDTDTDTDTDADTGTGTDAVADGRADMAAAASAASVGEDGLAGLEIDETFFELVLRKSCSTNEAVDRLVGMHA